MEEMMYEVNFDFNYGSGITNETVQVPESRLKHMQESEAAGKNYCNVKVLSELGLRDTKWIDVWFELGKSNPWISESEDPKFSKNSFTECKTIDYLIKLLKSGNWSLGQAFYYKDLCFINQIDGGSEFLVIRGALDFESFSCRRMLETEADEIEFKQLVERILSDEVTDVMLRNWDYKLKS